MKNKKKFKTAGKNDFFFNTSYEQEKSLISIEKSLKINNNVN